MVDGLVIFSKTIYVSDSSEWKNLILKELHVKSY